MEINENPTKLKPSDFASDQEVRWCPGCGDYAILKAVQKCLAELNADKAKTVFVSGIGCASRLPYYMSTYGFHTIQEPQLLQQELKLLILNLMCG